MHSSRRWITLLLTRLCFSTGAIAPSWPDISYFRSVSSTRRGPWLREHWDPSFLQQEQQRWRRKGEANRNRRTREEKIRMRTIGFSSIHSHFPVLVYTVARLRRRWSSGLRMNRTKCRIYFQTKISLFEMVLSIHLRFSSRAPMHFPHHCEGYKENRAIKDDVERVNWQCGDCCNILFGMLVEWRGESLLSRPSRDKGWSALNSCPTINYSSLLHLT